MQFLAGCPEATSRRFKETDVQSFGPSTVAGVRKSRAARGDEGWGEGALAPVDIGYFFP